MKKIDVNFLEPSKQQLNDLLEYYQAGRYEDAEKLSLSITQEFPKNQFAWKVLGAALKQIGKINESLVASQKSVQLNPQDAEAHNNLGNTLRELGRLDEAETSYRKAITIKPDFAGAHNNLGNTLQGLGRLEEAEISVRQAITLKPDFAEAHNNLGNTLIELGRFNESEASYRKAIESKPDYTEAHYNLGVTLHELGRLDEAETSLRQAITLNPDFTEAHNNLANTLKDQGRLKEAEISYTQAITLKADYADAHVNLDLLIREKDLLRKIFYKKKTMGKDKATDINSNIRLTFNPFISHRDAEIELLKDLYKVNFKKLNTTSSKDARYGNGKCSDFKFFENDLTTIKTVAEDLISIMKQAVKSDIYVMDSFLNIYGAGSGTTPHKHITNFDKNQGLTNQKFSLTYYLSVGDQNCSEPGNLKVYEPSNEILLSNGMIIILPAFRNHSAVYNGKKDRVMIGVNFYSLI